MNRDDVLDAQAALSELYNACSPPSHSDMDVAFARAKVESPRTTPTRDVNKRDRVRVAFEYALERGDDCVNPLIDELVRALRQARIFTSAYQSDDIAVFTSELQTALRSAGRILDDEGRLQPAPESPLPPRRAAPASSAQPSPHSAAASPGLLVGGGESTTYSVWSHLTGTDALPSAQADAPPKAIFLVHGHNETAALRVQKDVRRITGIEPTILADQPSAGRTVIEKFERYATQSQYAIVLMTRDDEMAHQDSAGRPVMRARQNVILELGYFIGKLGRSRVLVLQEGVEWPSDIAGVVYISVTRVNWMEELRSELREAGFPIVG